MICLTLLLIGVSPRIKGSDTGLLMETGPVSSVRGLPAQLSATNTVNRCSGWSSPSPVSTRLQIGAPALTSWGVSFCFVSVLMNGEMGVGSSPPTYNSCIIEPLDAATVDNPWPGITICPSRERLHILLWSDQRGR